MCDAQDTSCLLADMNGSRSKLSGRAPTSPLLWSGGPGELAEKLKRYPGINSLNAWYDLPQATSIAW